MDYSEASRLIQRLEELPDEWGQARDDQNRNRFRELVDEHKQITERLREFIDEISIKD